MKSLAELAAIRDKMKDKVVLREGTSDTRIVVGMATCGIAAGARPVLAAFVEGVNDAGLNSSVTVSQTGCIGICQYEPVVEIFEDGMVVTPVELIQYGITKKLEDGVKIMGNGDITKKLTVKANALSASAKEKIEAAGGKAEVV